MSCIELGEWIESVRADGAVGDVFRSRARDASVLIRHAAGCDACRGILAEARGISSTLGGRAAGRQIAPHEHPDAATIAEWLTRNEIPAETLACAECSDLLIESARSINLEDAEATGEESLASDLTRRRIERIALGPITASGPADSSDPSVLRGSPPAPTSARRWWVTAAALVPAAAALALVVVHFSPASEPWARSVDLNRGSLWRMPGEVRDQVRAAAEDGRLSEPLFTVPDAPLAIERDAFRVGRAPWVLTPRWEAVLTPTPVFRWDNGVAAQTSVESPVREEVLLLDGNRRFVWSGKASNSGELEYPADAPALEPGATYFWKVNRETEAGVLASAYAAFRVLEKERASECRRGISRYTGSPFTAGVVADGCGLYSKAAKRFELATDSLDDPSVAERALKAVWDKQGFNRKEGAPMKGMTLG